MLANSFYNLIFWRISYFGARNLRISFLTQFATSIFPKLAMSFREKTAEQICLKIQHELASNSAFETKQI